MTQDQSRKDLVIRVFKEIIESTKFDLEAINRFFDRSYIQTVDGKTLQYDEFLSHLKKQKDALASANVRILAVMQDDDVVFTNHEVTAVKKNGEQVKFKVMAQFTIRDQKIVACDELTRMIEGKDNDRDLGSRH